MQLAADRQRRGRALRYLAPFALAALLAAVVIVIATSHGRSGSGAGSASSRHRTVHVPPYWTAQPGDTYAEIAQKTGLTIAQLEAYNPDTGPDSLIPGQRLNLWQHPPPPPKPPPLPRFWTVRPGDSLGLIADKTGVNLAQLEQLNPKFASAPLQPGDRVKLRP